MRDFQRFTLLKSQSQVNRQVGAVDNRDLISSFEFRIDCVSARLSIMDTMANKKSLKISFYYNYEKISF